MKQFFKILGIALISCFGQHAIAQNMIGVAKEGGVDSLGTIFTLDENGAILSSYALKRTKGRNPVYTKLMEGNDGMIYGTTMGGGDGDYGTIFHYDPDRNIYVHHTDFDSINGKGPRGGMTLASNGKMYGMTKEGGTNNNGVLYEFDPSTNAINKLADFDDIDGQFPYGHLTEFNGILYGLTAKSTVGTLSGMIFSYNPATNVINPEYYLGTNLSDPNISHGSFIVGNDDKLYALSRFGGAYDEGTIFSFEPGQTNPVTVLHSFVGFDGSDPRGDLLLASDGNMYGMTATDAGDGNGVLFSYDPVASSYTLLSSMYIGPAQNYAHPSGALIELPSGELLGTSYDGGIGGVGAIFSYNIGANTFSTIHNLAGGLGGNGQHPYGTFMESAGGRYYTLCYDGGQKQLGTLIEFHLANSQITKRLDFGFASDGSNPEKIVLSPDGMIYGVCSRGGVINSGLLFSYNPISSEYSKLFTFSNNDTGYSPYGKPLLIGDKLYLTTVNGGPTNKGAVIIYDLITGIDTVFTLESSGTFFGDSPNIGLVNGNNGLLYCATNEGGANNFGTLFSIDPITGNIQNLHDFDQISGRNPVGELFVAPNNKIYGATLWGGNYNEQSANGDGTIYEFDIATSTYTKLYDFQGSVGGMPRAGFVMANDGKLYITTSSRIYSLDIITNTVTNVATVSTFWSTYAEMIQAQDGKLYGVAAGGGSGNNTGGVYAYDPQAQTVTATTDFLYEEGSYSYSNLVQMPESAGLFEDEGGNSQKLKLFPNPTSDKITLTTTESISDGLISIYSIDGALIFSEKMNGTETELNVSGFESGMYLLRVTHEGISNVSRIVKN